MSLQGLRLGWKAGLMTLPQQDGARPFDARSTVGGRGLYGLDQALGDQAHWSAVDHTADGVGSRVPLVDPFSTSFAVDEFVVDRVATWFNEIQQSPGPPAVSIPGMLQGDDRHVTITPVTLVAIQLAGESDGASRRG